ARPGPDERSGPYRGRGMHPGAGDESVRGPELQARAKHPGSAKFVPGNTKTPGGRARRVYLSRVVSCELGGLTGLAQRALAARADVEPDADPIHDDALLVHVRAEIPVRAALREAHIIAK